jgi:hypothetical protein
MSAGWVAGSVRARAMARRRLGATGARRLAGCRSLPDALTLLVTGPYGRAVHRDQNLAEAEHAVAAALLWNLRVLAGWLPRAGGGRLRVLAGWFELANIDELLCSLQGRPAAPPFALGRLATAWTRVAMAPSAARVREILGASSWGDPGGETPRLVRPALRLAWAERVVATVPGAAGRAREGAALLVAGELVAGRTITGPAAQSARRLLGAAAPQARSIADLATAGPDAARALAGVVGPADLWRAEARWWVRTEAVGFALLRRPHFTFDPVLGAVTAAAADTWRVRAALQAAARGGAAAEVLDELA